MHIFSISILFFAILMQLNITIMSLPLVYHRMNRTGENIEENLNIKRSDDHTAWIFRSSSSICDYRLQFRPIPLTATHCGYGHYNKGDHENQVHPFKYG
ncbi:hypothetical protein I4U23_008543 [Adineta vaga]|nr:hypothetical protein I4U23_008543 [Adineta vaga]